MSVTNFEPIFEPIFSQAGRRAIVAVLRAHPEWTLAQVCSQLERDVPIATVMRQLTLGELLSDPGFDLQQHPSDGGPPPDYSRLEAAQRLVGEAFDACICEVLEEAGARSVGAAYLRARVGGPRSKLQAALRRLLAAGTIARSGTTSGTRYHLADRS